MFPTEAQMASAFGWVLLMDLTHTLGLGCCNCSSLWIISHKDILSPKLTLPTYVLLMSTQAQTDDP